MSALPALPAFLSKFARPKANITVLRWGETVVARGSKLDLVFWKGDGAFSPDTLRFLIESRPFSLDGSRYSVSIRSGVPQTVTLSVTVLRGGPLNLLTHQRYFDGKTVFTLQRVILKGSVSSSEADGKETARNIRLDARAQSVKRARELAEVVDSAVSKVTSPKTLFTFGATGLAIAAVLGFLISRRI